jgi:hypothetical protein
MITRPSHETPLVQQDVNAVNWAASFEALTERIGAALRVWKRGNVVDLISLGLLSSVERKSGW